MNKLRKYIRHVLIESLRMGENLMILNHPKDKNKVFLLVDADYLDDVAFGGDYGFEKMSRDYVKGMMQLAPPKARAKNRECYGSLMVKRSSAEDGYGPTMYDIVMEITNQPLINDRDSVSREAESMMKYYLTNRGDVDKKLLDNVDDPATYPRTPEVEDDCTPGDDRAYENGRNDRHGLWEDDPLSYAYDKQMSSRAAEMLAKGNECIAKHKMEYWDIRKLASDFFRTRY